MRKLVQKRTVKEKITRTGAELREEPNIPSI